MHAHHPQQLVIAEKISYIETMVFINIEIMVFKCLAYIINILPPHKIGESSQVADRFSLFVSYQLTLEVLRAQL